MKRKTTTITEKELRELYFDREMSLDDVGRYFGYADRQPIQKLFKKYGIVTRSKSTLASMRAPTPPSKEDFVAVASTMSDIRAAAHFRVHRSNIAEWRRLYDVPNDWFKNTDIIESIKSKEHDGSTPIEIAEKLNLDVGFVKQHRNFDETIYSIDKVKELVSKIDMDGQGSTKELKLSDPTLWKSILHYVDGWEFSTDKATERAYRLVNDMQEPIRCSLCDKPSNFLTYREGYHLGGCKGCLKKGVSGVSQRLFENLLEKLPKKEHKLARFHNHQGEQLIYVNEEAKKANPNTEFKYRYYLDFVYRKQVIEFDGVYWHKDTKEKDAAKDIFLEYRGYSVLRVTDVEYKLDPEGTIKRCMKHLNV